MAGRRPHSKPEELEARRSWCLLVVRGLQQLPPGLCGVSGEEARAAVCYPTLQKMLAQLGGKEPIWLPFNYSVAELPGATSWSQRKILAGAFCTRVTQAGVRWEPEGERGSLACAVLVPQCHALAAHTPFCLFCSV